MYTFIREQFVQTDINTAWDFLKNPANLDRITPPDLQFEIISEVPRKMFDGLIIEYRIRIPGFGVRKWVAEIKHIKEMHSFVDEQRIGPYNFWYHYHQIDQVDGSIKLIDRVYYKVPYGVLGRLLHFLLIHRTLERIFSYRMGKLYEILNKGN
jgi:ligand-binding SRPBCC domain-containing protein